MDYIVKGILKGLTFFLIALTGAILICLAVVIGAVYPEMGLFLAMCILFILFIIIGISQEKKKRME